MCARLKARRPPSGLWRGFAEGPPLRRHCRTGSQRGHDPFAGATAANIDVAVVGVPAKAVTASGRLPDCDAPASHDACRLSHADGPTSACPWENNPRRAWRRPRRCARRQTSSQKSAPGREGRPRLTCRCCPAARDDGSGSHPKRPFPTFPHLRLRLRGRSGARARPRAAAQAPEPPRHQAN